MNSKPLTLDAKPYHLYTPKSNTLDPNPKPNTQNPEL